MSDLMLKLYVSLQTLRAREEGQGMVEYALILALVSVVAVAPSAPGGDIDEVFDRHRGRARRRRVSHVAASPSAPAGGAAPRRRLRLRRGHP